MSSIVHCDICGEPLKKGFLSDDPHGKCLRYRVQKQNFGMILFLGAKKWQKVDVCQKCISQIIEKTTGKSGKVVNICKK